MENKAHYARSCWSSNCKHSEGKFFPHDNSKEEKKCSYLLSVEWLGSGAYVIFIDAKIEEASRSCLKCSVVVISNI